MVGIKDATVVFNRVIASETEALEWLRDEYPNIQWKSRWWREGDEIPEIIEGQFYDWPEMLHVGVI